MRARIVALIVAVALVAGVVAVPSRAQAIEPLIYIIPAAIAGVGILVGVIVATASSDEPHFLQPKTRTNTDRRQPRVRFSTQCQPVDGVAPLMCW